MPKDYLLSILSVRILAFLLCFGQAGDTVAESSYRLVDVLCLFQSHEFWASLVQPLRPCKIHNCEKCFSIMLLLDHFRLRLLLLLVVVEAHLLIGDFFFFNPDLFQENVEDSVRSTREFIHASLVDLSATHALLHEWKELVLRFYMNLSQTFNKDTSFRVFSDLELWYFPFDTCRNFPSTYWVRRSTSSTLLLLIIWCWSRNRPRLSGSSTLTTAVK